MRVGLVIYGDLEHPSGGFLYDRMLLGTLRQAGDEVAVISLPWESYGRCLAHNLSNSVRTRLRDWQGDLLLQDELVHPSLFLVNRIPQRTPGFPIVSIVHHLRTSEKPPGVGRWISRIVERAYLRTVDAFVFNGEVTRQSVRLLCTTSGPGIVAPPGGDRLGSGITEADIDARAADGNPFRVLFVGNLIPRKGLLTLLRALAMSAGADWLLTVAGSRAADPAHVRQVDRFVTERGLGESVRMRDHLTDGELAAELRAAHVLAVPSAYEGFGIVYLEAMGFGVVPIGSTEGGATEVIEDGRSGFLVRPGDAAALAAVIERLRTNRELLGSCARAALLRFRQFSGWEARMKEVRAWLVALAREGS